MSALGLAIVGVMMTVLFVIIAIIFPASYEYDPHDDPVMRADHDPLYCPVCRARRTNGRY